LSADRKVLITWSDKATDKNNLWFLGIDLEDSGRFAEAAKFYIKDAIFSWEKNRSFVRAALSCACAANCLEKLSEQELANRLHYESATVYEMHADQIFNKSVREALWALERAYQGYMQAQRKDKAEEILYKHKSLAAKVNLFSIVDITASTAPTTEDHILQTQTSYFNNNNNNNTSLDAEQLVQHIDLFLKIRSSNIDEAGDNNAQSKRFSNPQVKKMQPYWNQSY
jgi:hypothetical protein